ncbi:prephenate dehydrogenase [Betaproteobacteria bacterium]|nr:prephenate dehydrogenase [Betaproteobacteria bacterium]
MIFERVLVLGCGLIGSSLAASVREYGLAKEIVGVDEKYELMRKKNRFFDKMGESLQSFEEADLCVIAIPIEGIPAVVKELADSRSQFNYDLITDVASNKKSLLEVIDELKQDSKRAFLSKFISSHPLAGSEQGGWESASTGLFEKTVCLLGTPGIQFGGVNNLAQDQECSTYKQKVAKLERFWKGIGCRVEHFPLEEHDQFLSIISHFPHLLAFSVGLFMSSSDYDNISKTIHGTGFKDFTRIAASPPSLWADILMENRNCILSNGKQWLESYKEFTHALEKGDKGRLITLISESSIWRNSLGKSKSSL